MNIKYKNTEYLRQKNHFYDRLNLYPFCWNYCLMCKHCEQVNNLILKCNLEGTMIIRVDTTDFMLNCTHFEKREEEK
jgi:hypothetical protein